MQQGPRPMDYGAEPLLFLWNKPPGGRSHLGWLRLDVGEIFDWEKVMRKMLAGVVMVFLTAGAAWAQQNDPGKCPTQDDLKNTVGFDDEQLKKSEPIVTEYTPKIKAAADKLKDAQDPTDPINRRVQVINTESRTTASN